MRTLLRLISTPLCIFALKTATVVVKASESEFNFGGADIFDVLATETGAEETIGLLETIDCYAAALATGFNGTDFDRYDEFFRDDSIVAFAQTGIYKGAADIAEYLRFVTDASPYVESIVSKFEAPILMEYDKQNDVCVFLSLSRNTFTMDPATTLNNAKAEALAMVKVFYSRSGNFIERLNGLYPAPFLDYFFGDLLVSENTRNYVCSVLLNQCSGIVNDFDDVDDDDCDLECALLGGGGGSSSKNAQSQCISALKALPGTQGAFAYIDGNSQGCRALHADFAEENPDDHCPHVSLSPLEDPQGRIKCQTSESVEPSDLFSPEDFEAFEEYALANGFDPQTAYVVLDS